MTIADLIPGATYMVRYDDSSGDPEYSYHGLAVYQGYAPEGYIPGTLTFAPEKGGEEVYCGIEHVYPLGQHQGALLDQLTELHRIATKLKLYDAADWLRGHLVK